MVKLQFMKTEAEVIEEEPPRRERKPRENPLAARVAELEREIANLIAACDRLNSELRARDREMEQMRAQLAESIDLAVQIALLEALIRRISVLKMNGKTGILAELRHLLELIRNITTE